MFGVSIRGGRRCPIQEPTEGVRFFEDKVGHDAEACVTVGHRQLHEGFMQPICIRRVTRPDTQSHEHVARDITKLVRRRRRVQVRLQQGKCSLGKGRPGSLRETPERVLPQL